MLAQQPLRAGIPAMFAEVTRLADGLTADEIQRLPARALFFQARCGRLGLARQCPTPVEPLPWSEGSALATPAPSE